MFPLVDVWPLMLGIMADMDQKDSGIVVVMAAACAWLVLLVSLLALCPLRLSSGLRCSASWLVWIRGTVPRCVLFKVVDILVVTQRLFLMVEIPQLLVDKVIDVPVSLVLRVPQVRRG